MPAFDLPLFFSAWLREPRRVAAIVPSGAALASAITAGITPDCAPVIELGPGTGVFTRELLARGIPEADLALIESGAEFARVLRRRFPAALVVTADAACLKETTLFGARRAGAVVSGLPLLTMPAQKVTAILEGAFDQLRPEGAFYQFTYGFGCPVPRRVLDRLGLKAARTGGALINMPPASVYCIRRHLA
ncbi:MAG TPA: hypothetical protein VMI53_03825 [Opitutaceae bacterium]|nr:hypothetical protein [Opitutaceae bacterium]